MGNKKDCVIINNNLNDNIDNNDTYDMDRNNIDNNYEKHRLIEVF